MRNFGILVTVLVLLASPCLSQSIIELPFNNGKLDSFFATPITSFIQDPLIVALKSDLEQGKLDMVTIGRRNTFNDKVSFWMSVKRKNDFLVSKTNSSGGKDMITIRYYQKSGQERLLYTTEFNEQAIPSEIYVRLTSMRLIKLYKTSKGATICDMFLRVKAAPIGRKYETFDNSPYCFIKKCIILEDNVPYELEWFFEFAEMLKDQVNNKLEEDASVQQRLQDWLDKDND